MNLLVTCSLTFASIVRESIVIIIAYVAFQTIYSLFTGTLAVDGIAGIQDRSINITVARFATQFELSVTYFAHVAFQSGESAFAEALATAAITKLTFGALLSAVAWCTSFIRVSVVSDFASFTSPTFGVSAVVGKVELNF